MFTQFGRAGIVNALIKHLNLRMILVQVPPLSKSFKFLVTQNHQDPRVLPSQGNQSVFGEVLFGVLVDRGQIL